MRGKIVRTIIALDTATENCSAALWYQDKLTSVSELALHRHAELILKMIDELLQKSGVNREQIDYVAYDCGPGSFTGVRVATAAAQGLALGLKVKAVAVSSLEAMAAESLSKVEKGRAICAIDARMGEVYLGLYQKQNGNITLHGQNLVLKPGEALDLIDKTNFLQDGMKYAGTGIKVLEDHGLKVKDEVKVFYPEASYILRQALVKISKAEILEPEDAMPLYLRNEVTWKKLSEQGAKI